MTTPCVDILVDKQAYWVEAGSIALFLLLLALFFLLVRKVPVFLLLQLVLSGSPSDRVLYPFPNAFDLIIHDLASVGLKGHLLYACQQGRTLLRFAQVNEHMALADQGLLIVAVYLQHLVYHVACLGKALGACLAQLDETQTHVIQNRQLKFLVYVVEFFFLELAFVELKSTKRPDVNLDGLVIVGLPKSLVAFVLVVRYPVATLLEGVVLQFRRHFLC